MLAKIIKKSLLAVTGLLVAFSLTSCTDLSENPPSQVTNNKFFQTDQQFISALGAAYSKLSAYGSVNQRNLLAINEVSSDELVVPQRGQDWYDGGSWIRLHRQTWKYEDQLIDQTWTFLYGGVNSCNRLIYQFNNLLEQGKADKTQVQKFVSELKVLRAFYYYWLLDSFGNVPIVTKFKDANAAPPNNDEFKTGRKELFNFIETQIKNNVGDLSKASGQSTYGRMNVWSAHFLLAKLYLNSNVYTGTPRWQEALTQINTVINSGNYSLTSDIFTNFKTQNKNSPEIIFTIPYDQVFFQGNNWDFGTLHFAHQKKYNLKGQPWNGFTTPEDFYKSFKKEDDRKNGFLEGYQYDAQGNYLFDPSHFSGEPHGDTLFLTPHINELEPRAWREAGVRFNKFEYANGATENLSNDYPIFRYSDALLTKAEILWRIDPSSSEALHLINMIRERAGLSDYTSLSGYKILKERGHELYTENWRRQDLVRFSGGKHYKYNSDGEKISQYSGGQTAFNDAWWEKDVTDEHRNVFPIPRNQMQTNPNLKQNPGY